MLCRSLPSPACHAISSFTEPNPTRHEPEKASIDEAFIDFTRPVRAELLARYPYLGQVPADAPNGLDTVLPPPPPILWENRGILIPIDPPCEDQAGSSSAHETGTYAAADSEDGDDDARRTRTWHDVALSIAAELMDKIRAEVRIQLGYTTSAVGFYFEVERLAFLTDLFFRPRTL